jgi:hypothetical protein
VRQCYRAFSQFWSLLRTAGVTVVFTGKFKLARPARGSFFGDPISLRDVPP